MRLIDADQCIDYFCEHLTDDVMTEAINAIEEMPTIDASPVRHGKWLEKHHAYSDEEPIIEEWQSCKCSECRRYDTRPYLYYFSEPKFCSWCGARMDGARIADTLNCRI